MAHDWLTPPELRIGLGCMRLSTDPVRDEVRAHATIGAALAGGVTIFDTARAYGPGAEQLGHNERLLAAGLRAHAATGRARIVTKGGMTRAGGGWVPDGRAKAVRSDCEASLAALDGLPIDTYLLHAPDPRTPWRTSVRALAALVAEGLVARVGVSNVNRAQLDEALELAPISAVQVALSVHDDRPLRGGILERCVQRGIALIAHSPLGGPRRAGAIARLAPLPAVAAAHGATPADVALGWLLSLSPAVVAIPGARRPETARAGARAAALRLTDVERETLDAAFGGARAAVARQRPTQTAPGADGDSEVVLIMGIPGAGKTRVAGGYVRRGYDRLNRDERGGSLRGIAQALEEHLAAGGRRVVVDNTYLTRAARSHVIETAARHGLAVRCVWLNTPLAQAQVNLVGRLIELCGRLPTPEELRVLARSHQGVMAPASQMRALRELEPPSLDEGFAGVQEVAFARADDGDDAGRATAVIVAAPALELCGWEAAIAAAEPAAPHLVFDWDPDGVTARLQDGVARLRGAVRGTVEGGVCTHGGGPPRCWCRPPLPGLALAFAAAHGLELSPSILIGSASPHRTLANALGARYIPLVA